MQLIKKENINKTGLLPTVETRGLSRPKICKQIDALQDEIFKAIMDAHDADDWQDAAHYILDVMPRSFAALFGSKCLPNEPLSQKST